MFPSDTEIMTWFAQYAYQPWLIYTAVIAMMTLSSFGLPLPEEVTILALGLIVYMGRNPDLYPPPSLDSVPVDLTWAMIICFLAVFLSDFLVYFLGRKFGQNSKVLVFIHRFISPEAFDKTKEIIQKHSFWVPAIFRFTPGIRFPGHFSCGMLGIKPWQFLTTDGLAALISVPTQVFIFAYYGKTILSTITLIKQYLLIIILIVAVVVVAYKMYHWRIEKRLKEKLSKK